MFIALTNPFILFKDKIKIKIIPVKSATIMSKFKKFNVTITAIKGNNDKIIFGGFSNIFAVASASFSEVTNPSPFFFNVFSLRFKYQIDPPRSEEHTSELQSRGHLVCRLLLEKKKKNYIDEH